MAKLVVNFLNFPDAPKNEELSDVMGMLLII